MTEAAFPVEPAAHRNPRLGYLMALAAAALWGLNGAVSKVLLQNSFSSLELVELRSLGAFVVLAAAVAILQPAQLRVSRSELPRLAVFGVLGIALVQLFYLVAIRRLNIGIALLIEYTAPVLVALWARFVMRRPVRNRIWLALALALFGLALIVDVIHGVTLSGVGILAAALGAVAYATYMLLAEQAVGQRSAVSLLAYGFGFASIFWAVVAPWWRFPWGALNDQVSLLGNLSGVTVPVWLLVVVNVVVGTAIPFALIVRALRHLAATRVAITAMAEPVIAFAVAWAWLGESLAAVQLLGTAVVLVAIGLAQTSR